MPHHRQLTLLIAVGTLAACGRAPDDADAGGLTVGEAQALERAADRLDSRAPSPGAEDAKALERDVRERLATEQRENAPD